MKLEPMPVSQLAVVNSGGGAPQEASAFGRTGSPFVRAGSLPKLLNGDGEDSLEKLEPDVAERYGLKLFPAGTVLFAKSGISATKGYVYRLREEAYVVNHLAALIPHDRNDGRFLERALQKFSPTTLIRDPVYPSIRLRDIERMKILAPCDPEHRQRIAENLDKADALRAKRRAALAQLDILAQSVFLDMFGDPIVNPRNWPLQKLATLGSLDRGVSKHRPRNAPELLGGPYPLVQTGDVANSGGYIREYSATYSEAGLRQSKLWPAGTLCITIAANIARAGILRFDACFPDSVVGFQADEPATVEFVRGWLSFLQASLEKRAPESAQKNINLDILRRLEVPTPDIFLRREFARRVDAIESLKDHERHAIAKLDALFTSLQQRAFQGEL